MITTAQPRPSRLPAVIRGLKITAALLIAFLLGVFVGTSGRAPGFWTVQASGSRAIAWRVNWLTGHMEMCTADGAALLCRREP